MVTFHYVICDVPRKEKYHVKKLIFIDEKLEKTEDLVVNQNQLNNLKNDISEKQYTIINESKIDLDSFLKNINLIRVN